MDRILQDYICSFRVRELQQCLDALGLKKHGLKTELQHRLLDLIRRRNGMARHGGDQAARIITEVYCGMKGLTGLSGAMGLNGLEDERERDVAQTLMAMPGSRIDAPSGSRQHVQSIPMNPYTLALGMNGGNLNRPQAQCFCSSNMFKDGRMVKCAGKGCGIWQHTDCVLPPGPIPQEFHCARCRCARADPFWADTGEDLVPPTKLKFTGRNAQANGVVHEVLVAEKVFFLKTVDIMEKLRCKDGYRLQVVSILLTDDIPHRYHWPRNCTLKINNMQYRVYGRSPNNCLGNNQRDEPANVGMLCRNGRNNVSITCTDARPFCFFVQIVEKRSKERVESLMHAAETLEEAHARVVRQVKKGSMEDDDNLVVTSSVVVSLKCPLSALRIVTPARFCDVDQVEAIFDLDSFLSVAERTRKWACPQTMKGSCVQRLQRDVYMDKVLQCLKMAPDVSEVEVSPEGKWRPAASDHRWRSIFDDVADAAVVTAAAAKEEDSYWEESEDEMEELQRAAQAVRASTRNAGSGDEIINLLSDSEDEGPSGLVAAPQVSVDSVAAAHKLSVERLVSNSHAGPRIAVQHPSRALRIQIPPRRPCARVPQMHNEHLQQQPLQQRPHQQATLSFAPGGIQQALPPDILTSLQTAGYVPQELSDRPSQSASTSQGPLGQHFIAIPQNGFLGRQMQWPLPLGNPPVTAQQQGPQSRMGEGLMQSGQQNGSMCVNEMLQLVANAGMQEDRKANGRTQLGMGSREGNEGNGMAMGAFEAAAASARRSSFQCVPFYQGEAQSPEQYDNNMEVIELDSD
ncbi:unnamed protein product [Ostreobium quekettii]|uniref:SAP domain-containing protein n=1 Tax=Ostreobium quekettii TaxID=121088 RepID=A0A8S1JDH3_9CHLO|nr:unnamed protein product [Ostreobium quekettii]|eukprot:evm.model.scf_935.1 EVM.evm.TU.scf_935.1   scf_935:6853-12555(+)